MMKANMYQVINYCKWGKIRWAEFSIFHGFQDYLESFSMNFIYIIQASYDGVA